MDRETQNCPVVTSSELDLYIPCNPSQNHSKLFYEYWQTHFKIYMEGQKTQKSQHSIEGEEQSWRTNAIQLQDCYETVLIFILFNWVNFIFTVILKTRQWGKKRSSNHSQGAQIRNFLPFLKFFLLSLSLFLSLIYYHS